MGGKTTCSEIQRILDHHQPQTPLLVKVSERGRGTYARRNVRKGEVLLSIPLQDALAVSRLERGINRYAVTLQHEWQTVNGTRFPWKLGAALQRGTPPSVALALWLSWMMKMDRMPFRAYYEASLPNPDMLTSLLLATKAEVVEIQFEEEIQDALAMHEWVHRAYVWNIRGQFEEEVGDLNQFTYMMALTMSRSFGIDTPRGPLALTVPFCDLSNHDFVPNCGFQLKADGLGCDDTSGFFQFISNQEIAQGAEVTISYGDQVTNWKLLKHYGFTLEGNPNDTVHFGYLDLLPAKMARHGRNVYDDGVARGFEYLQHCYKEGVIASLFAPGNNETHQEWQDTAQKLHAQCNAMLGRMPTDLEEDETMLATDDLLSPRLRSIVKYRAQKKRRIASCRAFLEKLLGNSAVP